MAVKQLLRLLLLISSPSWTPETWLSTLNRKEWPNRLVLLWRLSYSLEKENLLKLLTSAQKHELRNNLNCLNPKKVKTISSVKKEEVLFCVESASLRFADAIGKKASWNEKRKWLLSWFKSPSTLKLTETALYSDECIDRILKLYERKVQLHFRKKEIPKKYEEEAIYLDLSPEDLYTPYRVICQWGKSLKLKAGTRVVDLGSGVGRVPLTLGLLHPKVFFLGIELMQERHEMAESARKGLRISNVSFVCANAAKRGLPIADYYYFFNPFVGSTLRQVFRQLKNYIPHRKFRVAVAQIEAPWKHIKTLDWLKPVQHFKADKAWEGIGITVFES